MRTDAEVVERIAKIKDEDFFGFEIGDLIQVLGFDAAKPHLKEGVTEDQWKPESKEPDAVRARIVDYLPFAQEKCANERGLSAMRSIAHFRAWTWLLGDDEAHAFLSDEDNYPQYGRPMLDYLAGRFTPKAVAEAQSA